MYPHLAKYTQMIWADTCIFAAALVTKPEGSYVVARQVAEIP